MLRPKQVKNGTDGAGRISSILVVGWLIFGWSQPAFPDEQRHLKLAPIRLASDVGGDIDYTYLSNNFGTTRNTLQALGVQVRANVRALSYFWQPWFAQVSGDLGVVLSSSASRYGNPPATTNSGNTLVTGQAALNLLKYSRYPFQAHVFNNDNRASGSSSGINSDYKSSGYDLTQQYRSLRGNLDSLALYTHNENGRASFGTEEVRDSLNLNLTALPFKGQTFRIVGGFINIDRPLTGSSNYLDTLITNHLYQPNSSFSVASLINLIKSGYTSKPGITTLQQTDYNSRQLSSFASWRPIGSPMTITSSVRLLRSTLSSNDSHSSFDDTNFNLGANYAWSPLLRMYGSVNVNDNNNVQIVSTNAAVAAQKLFGDNPDAIILGGFRYTRYAGASLSNSTTTTSNSNQSTTTSNSNQTATTSVQSLGGNLGHALSKSTNLGSGLLTIGLDQRLSELLSTQHSPYSYLTSGGTLSWNRSEGRGSTSLRLRASDSRTLSGKQNFFQIINLQASRNVRLLNHQSLIGNLTIQSTRSGDSDVSTPFTTYPSASLSYHNERVFAVKNLTFNSTLNIVGAAIVSSQNSTNPMNFSTSSQASTAWDNDLNYFIGKLRLRLYSHIAVVNNGTQSSLLFTMNRSF